MIDTGDIDVFLGLDVGKGEPHATAVTPAGKKAFGRRLSNTEPTLHELFAKLKAKHGTALVVVDQPASIVRRGPTRGTRSSSRTRPAPCRTRCGRWTARTRRSPSWR
ncbi:hypothetical protein GCM10010302_10950 [Streptomyces polychromogenes]|uniref:Transposase IS110-like N-terminal domain-containing protein n=1 Tax=Streptomyces polychromogenes TaxID=67342 RepID=A0ABN0V4S0_9ACTN